MFCGNITENLPWQVPHLPQCSYGLGHTLLYSVEDFEMGETVEENECNHSPITFILNKFQSNLYILPWFIAYTVTPSMILKLEFSQNSKE